MIEFDVLSQHRDGSGELYVVHDHSKLSRGGAPTLGEALAHLTSPPFAGVGLQVDLKRGGYEARVLDALGAAGALERSFISSGVWSALQRIRQLAPELRVGWTVPLIPGVSGTPLITPTLGRLYRRRGSGPVWSTRSCPTGALSRRRSSARCSAPVVRSTPGRWTTRPRSADWRRSVSAPSSPTTRGSLTSLALQLIVQSAALNPRGLEPALTRCPPVVASTTWCSTRLPRRQSK